MRYQYGGNITITAPPGVEVRAQMGKMTGQGPVIHIPSYQMEAPADMLRAEGWGIPEIETGTESVHSITVEAKQIVDFLINEEQPLPFYMPPGKAGPASSLANKPKTKPIEREEFVPVSKNASCPNCGSKIHKAGDCPYAD